VPSALSNTVTPGVPAIVPGVGVVTKPATGTVTMRIPLTLDAASSLPTSVSYTTMSAPPDVNARAGVDYTTTSGSVTFAPGQIAASINVPVLANPAPVANDLFFVVFSNPQGATLGGFYGLGIGVIT
jgi:hypothetical protein